MSIAGQIATKVVQNGWISKYYAKKRPREVPRARALFYLKNLCRKSLSDDNLGGLVALTADIQPGCEAVGADLRAAQVVVADFGLKGVGAD